MTSQADSIYNEFLTKLQESMTNVDPVFLEKFLHIQKKLEDESIKEPFVTLSIDYSPEANIAEKIKNLQLEHSLKAGRTQHENQLVAASRMNLNDLSNVAEDTSIIKITGEVSPAVKA